MRREDIEDDPLGVYSPRTNTMAHAAAPCPDELAFEVLKCEFDAECYDGQPFFDADHAGERRGSPRLGLLVGEGEPWFLLDVSRPVKQFAFQTRIPYQIQPLTAATGRTPGSHGRVMGVVPDAGGAARA